MKALLALYLDGPLQAWGWESRFNRRTTALFPTKSGIVGLLAAAMGIDARYQPGDKAAQARQRAALAPLAGLGCVVFALPRWRPGRQQQVEEEGRSPQVGDFLPTLRLEDFHTVARTRRASDARKEIAAKEAAFFEPIDPKTRKDEMLPTSRHYLLDARFGVLLEGDEPLLTPLAHTLANPEWGLYLGRKCCIPAAPVLVGEGPFPDQPTAVLEILRRARLPETWVLEQFARVEEVRQWTDGSDTFRDHPLAFGPTAQERDFAPRRVRVIPHSALRTPPS